MTTIERPVKRSGGSLIIVIGKFERDTHEIDEGDTLVLEIKEVRKHKKRK